jgi:hypothetical protein
VRRLRDHASEFLMGAAALLVAALVLAFGAGHGARAGWDPAGELAACEKRAEDAEARAADAERNMEVLRLKLQHAKEECPEDGDNTAARALTMKHPPAVFAHREPSSFLRPGPGRGPGGFSFRGVSR